MRKRIILLLLATTMISITGCSNPFVRTTEVEDDSQVETVLKMKDLEDGGFYVLRGNKYDKLYVQDANYEIDEDANSSADSSRTLWYSDDWGKVPTMYKGDKLIYKTTDTLNETFTLERFAYVGYTIGISNLQKTDSGRYSFQPSTDETDINTDSDAKQMTELTTDTAIVDKIGGAYLRSGNISDGGCILGLSKGKTYLAEVYAGSVMHEYKLKADQIALTSMEAVTTVDYDFMESQILSIDIPDYFNSGYYLVNNYGLVRYVNGTSYNEDTDFNIPNVDPHTESESDDAEDSEDSATENKDKKTDDNESVKETVSIDSDGKYTITVTYEDSEETSSAPEAIFYSDEKAYKLKADATGKTLSKTLKLSKGDYTLEIKKLNGREYTYTVEAEAATFSSEKTSKK